MKQKGIKNIAQAEWQVELYQPAAAINIPCGDRVLG